MDVLRNLGAGLTLLLGIGWIVVGSRLALGLEAPDAVGRSELRAVGGLMAGLGAFALVSQDPVAFVAVGAAWLGAAGARVLDVARGRGGELVYAAFGFDAGLAILLLWR